MPVSPCDLPTKVILVDDHAIVRAGFRMLLATEGQIHIAAEAERGEDVWPLYEKHRPHVVIMDLSMPGIGGLETIRRLYYKDDKANILAFSVHNEPIYAQRALENGAKGYICKSSASKLLIEAIYCISRGQVFVDPMLSNNMAVVDGNAHYKAIVDSFSAREFDIFLRLAKGFTSHKIADELCLGYKTVSNYGTQIRTKLNVATVAELAHIALALGLMKTE